jgi:nucleoside 2-deoxyribosyltransferase
MNAFVLMPFDKSFDDIYQLGIVEASEKFGISASRLDKQIFVSDMLLKIYNEIDNADFIIADMSKRNPNVFYEVGYADAKKKIVLLLTNNADDIPFDLKHRPHIIYTSVSNLREQLTERLVWILKEYKDIHVDPISTRINIIETDVIREVFSDDIQLKLRIELHNRLSESSAVLNSIYFLTSRRWNIKYEDRDLKKTIDKDNNQVERHILVPDIKSIPANDWIPIDIIMRKNVFYDWNGDEVRKDEYDIKGLFTIVVNTDTQNCKENHILDIKFEYQEAIF